MGEEQEVGKRWGGWEVGVRGGGRNGKMRDPVNFGSIFMLIKTVKELRRN